MRVAQILASNEDGGLEKHYIELCNALSKKIEIFAICDKKFEKFLDEDVKFIEFDFTSSRNNPFMLYRLYKILKELNVDIIHTQANKSTDILIRLKPFLKSKIVATLHSQKRDVKSFNRVDFVITVSKRIAQNITNKNHKVIYNGISIAEFEIDKNYIEKNFGLDGFVFVSIGRLESVKGYEKLIKSFAGIDAKLLIIGQGSEEQKLRALIDKENLKARVHIDSSYRDDIYKVLASSGCSIISSEREGFSYVFIESLMLQTPLISRDVADIKGFIGEKYISDDLNQKMRFVLNNYDEVLRDFEPIFKNIKKRFTFENMLNETLNLYKEIL